MRDWKFLLINLMVLLLVGCATEKSFWEKTVRRNTIQAYDEYLAKYPKGRYVRDAQNRKLEEKAWEKARQINTFTSYSEYIRSYPNGRYVEKAREEIAKSYLLNDQEIDQLEELIKKNPKEAQKLEYIDKLIFTGASCLDQMANWIDRVKGRKIYDLLKKYNSQILIDSIERVVLVKIDRLKVLFLTVKLGISGTEEALNNLLMKYGDKSMAEDFLNSGSRRLREGGADWARANGYLIGTGPGSHRVFWGVF